MWETRFGKIGCWSAGTSGIPEAARLAALGGAELLVYPTAIGWLPEEKAELGEAQHCAWETVQRGHAVANGCFLAAVNRTGTEGETEFWGQSFAVNPYGEVMARGSAGAEEILLVTATWPRSRSSAGSGRSSATAGSKPTAGCWSGGGSRGISRDGIARRGAPWSAVIDHRFGESISMGPLSSPPGRIEMRRGKR